MANKLTRKIYHIRDDLELDELTTGLVEKELEYQPLAFDQTLQTANDVEIRVLGKANVVPPDWASFISLYLTDRQFFQGSKRFDLVILIKCKAKQHGHHVFALCFGAAYFHIEHLLDHGFGISILEAMFDPKTNRINAIAEKSLVGDTLSSRRHYRRPRPAAYEDDFGKYYQEINSSLTDSQIRHWFPRFVNYLGQKRLRPFISMDGSSAVELRMNVSLVGAINISNFLERFRGFLTSRGRPSSIEQIDKTRIREFILYLQIEARCPRKNKPLSSATVQGYVRTLKAFFSWVKREEYIVSNPMDKVSVLKATTKVIITLSQDQIEKLIHQCRAMDRTSYRDLTIMLLLLDCGMRVSELASIELADIDFSQGYLKIRHSKGSKERIIPVGSLAQKTLWRYVNTCSPKPLTGRIEALLLTSSGLPLTTNGIQQMLRRIGRKADISGVRCSPHTFRHTFTKNYLMNGGDIFSLRKILCHSSLASVRIYLDLFAIDIKKQHQRFSPVDNLAEMPGLSRHLRSPNSTYH